MPPTATHGSPRRVGRFRSCASPYTTTAPYHYNSCCRDTYSTLAAAHLMLERGVAAADLSRAGVARAVQHVVHHLGEGRHARLAVRVEVPRRHGLQRCLAHPVGASGDTKREPTQTDTQDKTRQDRQARVSVRARGTNKSRRVCDTHAVLFVLPDTLLADRTAGGGGKQTTACAHNIAAPRTSAARLGPHTVRNDVCAHGVLSRRTDSKIVFETNRTKNKKSDQMTAFGFTSRVEAHGRVERAAVVDGSEGVNSGQMHWGVQLKTSTLRYRSQRGRQLAGRQNIRCSAVDEATPDFSVHRHRAQQKKHDNSSNKNDCFSFVRLL